MPLDEPPSDNSLLGESDSSKRKKEAEIRRDWETSRNSPSETLSNTIQDKADLESEMKDAETDSRSEEDVRGEKKRNYFEEAAMIASELIAKAGTGKAFEGDVLGIGGLDDVLLNIKRRVWVPLAAPPTLLFELGINPVRGLLLFGMPGCGKTLLARSLGNILSPMRPISVGLHMD
jgi:SpoVK/Ycf46/Vps4 family AAA+-type ATPase